MKEKQDKFRWQRLLEQSTEPLFLVDRERRILFVNAAFAQLTGFPLEQLRGRACRHHFSAAADTPEALLSVLSPPLEVLEGQPATTRRASLDKSSRCWDISFFPWKDEEKLLAILGKIAPQGTRPPAEPVPLPPQLHGLSDRGRNWHRLDFLPAEVPALRRVRDQVRWASRNREPVWISGAAGVGKQWLARALHQVSETGERTFLCLDCRRLPPALVMNQLTGERGRSEATGGGTIFLKDPQHLSGELQARVAGWFQGQRENPSASDGPRVVIGSRLAPDLAGPGSAWQEDFRCAFSVLHIQLPPLRERRAELESLTARLLGRAASVCTHKITGLSAEAWDLVQAAPWPGNVRELYEVLRQACQRCNGEIIQAGDLPWYLRDVPPMPEKTLALDAILEQVERRLLLLAMERSKEKKAGKTRVNKSRAAELLSIWRARLIRRLKELGIEYREEEDEET